MKRLIFVTKWFEEEQTSKLVDVYETEIPAGVLSRGPNLLADSEVETLRRHTAVAKRLQEIYTYFCHFILRNKKLPDDWNTIRFTNMYPNMYNTYCYPGVLIAEFIQVHSSLEKTFSPKYKGEEFDLEKALRDVGIRFGLKWIDLP